MLNEPIGSTAADGADDGRYSEQGLLLGKKVTQFISILCLTALVLCVLIAVFVFLAFPGTLECRTTGNIIDPEPAFLCKSPYFRPSFPSLVFGGQRRTLKRII